MNECVMGKRERRNTRWKDGRESKAKTSIRCGERRNWRLVISEEHSDIRRPWGGPVLGCHQRSYRHPWLCCSWSLSQCLWPELPKAKQMSASGLPLGTMWISEVCAASGRHDDLRGLSCYLRTWGHPVPCCCECRGWRVMSVSVVLC